MPAARTVITATLTAHSGSAPVTLYFADQAYTSGATDSPAHTFYDHRLIQAGNIARNLFDTRTTFGNTQVGYGEIVIANDDGAMDVYLSYGFAGFAIAIRRLTISDAGTSSAVLLTGVMDSADFSWADVRIKVRDGQQILANPLQSARYGGTNVSPSGLDGTANDIKGKPIPVLYGSVQGISPPLVNTWRRVYQVADAQVNISAVYDRGVALTAGAAYASSAALLDLAQAPAAGQYRVWATASGTYVRVGSVPTGTLTVDALQAGSTTPAALMQAVAARASLAFASADIAALAAAAPYAAGVWINDDASSVAVLDMLANSVGAWWGQDKTGAYRCAQVRAPQAASAVATLGTVSILSIERSRSADAGGGIPAWQLTLDYARIYTPQPDLAASVPDDYRAARAQAWRSAIANDAAVKTQWPKAQELRLQTYLITESHAQAEAARRLALYKVRRDTLTVRCRLDALSDAEFAAIDIGATVLLALPRFGMAAGKAFVITGVRVDLRVQEYELTLWG